MGRDIKLKRHMCKVNNRGKLTNEGKNNLIRVCVMNGEGKIQHGRARKVKRWSEK